MPLARSRAPENVLMQSTPARSSNCATRPLPALAMNTGTRAATLARSLARIAARDVRGTITGELQREEKEDEDVVLVLVLVLVLAGPVGHRSFSWESRTHSDS